MNEGAVNFAVIHPLTLKTCQGQPSMIVAWSGKR